MKLVIISHTLLSNDRNYENNRGATRHRLYYGLIQFIKVDFKPLSWVFMRI